MEAGTAWGQIWSLVIVPKALRTVTHTLQLDR